MFVFVLTKTHQSNLILISTALQPRPPPLPWSPLSNGPWSMTAWKSVATAGEAARRLVASSSCVTRVTRLPVVMGGATIASLKKGDNKACKLKLDTTALVCGTLANLYTVFKVGENGRLMAEKGLATRHIGVGDRVRQYGGGALCGLSLLLTLPRSSSTYTSTAFRWPSSSPANSPPRI